MIRPISKAAIHQICSNQVIVELAVAVKELVENSIDAGATSIDVRLKDSALTSIEVSDNGRGISRDNFASLCRKYHTSKLAEFADLSSLTSFGFRGEALSSLCGLGRLSVVTRTAKDEVGTTVAYSHDGEVVSTHATARDVGTTVHIAQLFHNVPVRHREFQKNIRREYAKLLSLLQSYAIICTDVRLKCTNRTKSGRVSAPISTQGSGSLKDHVAAVYGAKQVSSLVEIDTVLKHREKAKASSGSSERGGEGEDGGEVSATGCDEKAAKSGEDASGGEGDREDAAGGIRVSGFISSAEWRRGRSSADRQHFFINRRPVELPKVQRAINEVYRSFNTNQYPAFVLNFALDTRTYDVNVTPDKRTIFLHKERETIDALRAFLEKKFEPSRSSFAVRDISTFLRKPSNLGDPSGAQAASAEESDVMEDDLRDSTPIRGGGGAVSRTPSCSSRDRMMGADFLLSQKSASSGGSPSAHKSHTTPTMSLASFASGRKRKTPSGDGDRCQQQQQQRQRSLTPMLGGSASAARRISGSGSGGGARRRESLSLPSSKRKRVLSLPSRATEGTRAGGEADATPAEGESGEDESSPVPGDESSRKDRLVGSPRGSRHPDSRRSDSRHSDSRHSDSRHSSSSRSPAQGATPATSLFSLAGVRVTRVASSALASPAPEQPRRKRARLEAEDTAAATRTPTKSPAGADALPAPGSSPDFSVSSRRRMSSSPSRCLEDTDIEMSQTQRERPPAPASPTTPVSRSYHESVPLPAPQAAEGGGCSSPATHRDHELTFDAAPDSASLAERLTESVPFAPSALRLKHRARLSSAASRLRFPRDDSPPESAAVDASRSLRARLHESGGESGDEDGGGGPKVSEAECALSERAMQRVIEKADFERMEVLGQFNLGFIIARLGSDLFIVDQHATDEKFRFETLQRTTVLNSQALLMPKSLDITAATELTILDHLPLFEKNGFKFHVDEDAAPTRRVKLKAIPYSKRKTFGVEDIYEFAALLEDSSSTTAVRRLPKVSAMFASRACRSAVMIGTALDKREMTRILSNMSNMEHPWNCPHGRPTMRHMFDISALEEHTATAAARHSLARGAASAAGGHSDRRASPPPGERLARLRASMSLS